MDMYKRPDSSKVGHVQELEKEDFIPTTPARSALTYKIIQLRPSSALEEERVVFFLAFQGTLLQPAYTYAKETTTNQSRE